ncbi:hypothetical protein [Swingsia samuiensis]|uniref:Uncharacterized protein n=1 Tax=Swingsia samuiensis TaxID=1293412 RepID=A0A4Y6UM26_9PROT|nr:hypothetical protein [Swingsia samuiensis]QDH17728.1 hypothetical protein E3D00_09220 [Swingsia samuiensis]
MTQLSLYVLSDSYEWAEDLRQDSVLISEKLNSSNWAKVVYLSPQQAEKKHGITCACCSRGELVTLLSNLYLDHVLGRGNAFKYVLVEGENSKGIKEELRQDPLVSARYNFL